MEKWNSDTRSFHMQVLYIIIHITVLYYPHETRYKEKLLGFIQVCGLDSNFIYSKSYLHTHEYLHWLQWTLRLYIGISKRCWDSLISVLTLRCECARAKAQKFVLYLSLSRKSHKNQRPHISYDLSQHTLSRPTWTSHSFYKSRSRFCSRGKNGSIQQKSENYRRLKLMQNRITSNPYQLLWTTTTKAHLYSFSFSKYCSLLLLYGS